MDSFLDTTLIIKYVEYDYIKEKLRKKCFEYIQSSKGKILISFLVEGEAQRAVLKRKEMYENVLKKIENPIYSIDYRKSLFLNKTDVLFVEKLYLKLKEKNLAKLKEEFNSEIDFLNASIAKFLKNNVNEISIRKKELDRNIVSIIREFIEDFADCLILTSAIQMQQNKEQFMFVTADNHLDSGHYDFIENESRLEKFRKPKLKNLLYED